MDKEKLARLITDIPNEVGIYYMFDIHNNIIYIGKSIAIKKRILQHFRSTEYREKRIQEMTESISFEILGDELIALLYESELIKLHKPKFNRAQRRTIYTYALYPTIDAQGYIALSIQQLDLSKEEITTFANSKEGKEHLYYITEKYQLCQKINGLYPTKTSCFQYQLKMCNGACIKKELPIDYNARVDQYISTTQLPNGEIFLEVNGRNNNEKGIVYIKNGHYMGYGFCNKRARSTKVFLQSIVLKVENKDTRRILKRFIRRNGLYE